MSGNVRRLRRQSNLGLTHVESVADVPLALFEMEGECDQLLTELSEIEKLSDEQINSGNIRVFVEMFRERLTIMHVQAQACQRAFEVPVSSLEEPAPSLAVVS